MHVALSDKPSAMVRPLVPATVAACLTLAPPVLGMAPKASQEAIEVAIPQEVYTGTGDQLFDFLAATLKDFIDKHRGWVQQVGD